jgi:hypothetical protein
MRGREPRRIDAELDRVRAVDARAAGREQRDVVAARGERPREVREDGLGAAELRDGVVDG